MNATQLLAHFDRLAEAPNAVPRLRRFILDLAVRGKLVEQDAGDEPASTLLKQIESEIARLVKIGEMRKPKALPPIETEEEPFDAPTGWCWVRIRQVTSDRGQTTPVGEFTYIDVGSINKEAGVLGEHKVLSASDAPSRARKVVGKGDVLYSCVRPTLLNIAVVEDEIMPTPIASTAFAVLNSFGLVLPRYLWIALRSPYLEAIVESGMRGQAYPAINDAEFALLPLALPPLTEQLRIVAKVDELMAVCDQLEAAQQERERRRDCLAAASLQRLNQPAADTSPEAQCEHARFHLRHLPRITTQPEHIKAMRQTILNLAVSGKLLEQAVDAEPASDLLKRLQADIKSYGVQNRVHPAAISVIPDSAAPYPLPGGWIWTRLASLCRVVTDGDHLPPPKSDNGVAFLTIGNVSSGALSFANSRYVSQEYFDKITPYRKPEMGDILYTVVGASYGRPVLVETDQPFCVQRHIAILKPATDLQLRYLHLLLKSQLVYDQATASLTGTAQPTIPLRPLRNFLVPLPPLAEQHRIVAKVDELMALCDQLEAQLIITQTDSRRLLEAVLEAALAPA